MGTDGNKKIVKGLTILAMAFTNPASWAILKIPSQRAIIPISSSAMETAVPADSKAAFVTTSIFPLIAATTIPDKSKKPNYINHLLTPLGQLFKINL